MTVRIDELSEGATSNVLDPELRLPAHVSRSLEAGSWETWEDVLKGVFLSFPPDFVSTEWSGEPVSQVEVIEQDALTDRAKRAIALLDAWMSDTSDYDLAAWPELKEQLERDRLSARPLFP